MNYQNLHQHSTFSDGKMTIEQVVLTAIKNGMDSVGISDHSYTSIDESYCMLEKDYPNYLAEIERLQEKYKDKITIYKGIELDYYSKIDKTKFDYFIGSVHYLYVNDYCHPIDHSKTQQLYYIEKECNNNPLKLASDYYDLLVRHIEENKPTFVGHFDVITKFGVINEEDINYQQIAINALKKIIKTVNVFEVNTGAVAKGYKQNPYPNAFILKEILRLGGEVLLSADSHINCADIPNTTCFYFDESVKLLKEIGFKNIVKFTKNGFVKVEI